MIRPRRDIDDLDNLFDQDEAKRRREARAEMIENGRRREEMLNAQEARQRASAKESMLRASAAAIVREYEHAGVEPPKTNGDGVPTCSLSLLLDLGWRIENLGYGVKTLVAPPPPPKYVAKGECS